MTRPTVHLSKAVREFGSGDATPAIVQLLTDGLFALEAEKKAARIKEKGTAQKTNPFISDAGRCIRQVGFSLLNIEPSNPMTVDSLVNFLIGHAVEEAFARILVAQGAEMLREERVQIDAGNTVISGRSDFKVGGVRLGIDGSIIELKSEKSRSMSFLLKSGEPGRKEHRAQLNLYLHASQSTDHPSNAGILLYLIKNATKGEPIAHAWVVKYDRQQAEADIEALSTVAVIAALGELPEIPEAYAKQPNFPCKLYCDYRDHCWGGGDLIELLQKSIKEVAA